MGRQRHSRYRSQRWKRTWCVLGIGRRRKIIKKGHSAYNVSQKGA